MRILEVTTEHTGPFKTMIEVLKDMLTDTTIEFRSDTAGKNQEVEDTEKTVEEEAIEAADATNDDDDKDNKEKSGMRIMTIDTSRTVLINVKLDAKKFDTYKCMKKKLLIGVNMVQLYKIMKSMDKKDRLTMYIDHDDKNNLGIVFTGPKSRKVKKNRLKLLDLDDEKLNIPNVTFEAVITMNSAEFHRTCRDMSQTADLVEIQCLKDKLKFKCKGDSGDSELTYYVLNENEDDDEDEERNNETVVTINHISSKEKKGPEVVQGIFELKNLVIFSKCTSLCTDIEIFMKNDYPLVIRYTIATLGKILLCLTPVKSETKENEFSDENELYEE